MLHVDARATPSPRFSRTVLVVVAAFAMRCGARSSLSNLSGSPGADGVTDAGVDGLPGRNASDARLPPDTTDATDTRDGGVVCNDNAECGSLARCAGTGCGTPGTCVPAPVGTPAGLCSQPLAPVCGCDGQTYMNECSAVLSRVRIAHEGACVSSADAGS